MRHLKKERKLTVEKVSPGVLNLFGTSSEEIIARTKKEEAEYYLPKIDRLTSQIDDLSIKNGQLSSQNIYLKSLLAQNSIPFNLDDYIEN